MLGEEVSTKLVAIQLAQSHAFTDVAVVTNATALNKLEKN
jgi:hypothetical protein